MLTITHTHETGTLLEGTARGDGTPVILKRALLNWRWSRTLGTWYVPHSRDKMGDRYGIGQTAEALRTAGFEVTFSIDDTHRDIALAEAERAQRQDDRVAALAAKAERKDAVANAAHARAERDFERLPPGGEPIKPEHHSAPRHRRALDRAHSSMGASVRASEDAERAALRAQAATHTTSARHSRTTVYNRIKTLEADLRGVERDITGTTRHADKPRPATGGYLARLQARAAQLADQIAYWRDYADTHHPVAYGKHNVAKGDRVRVGGEWREVVRVNDKTVSVTTGYSWTDTVPWHRITGHEPAPAPDPATASAAPKKVRAVPVPERQYDVRHGMTFLSGVTPSRSERTATGWRLTFAFDGIERSYDVGPRGGSTDSGVSAHRPAR
jgi:hypothetical protein